MNGYEIIAVEDDHSRLTENQGFLVSFFDGKTGGDRLACRNDLNPAEIINFLPYVSLFELSLDEQATVKDIKCRLFGTGLVDFYGEWTGKTIRNNDSSDALKNIHPNTHDRLIGMINKMIRVKKPVTLYSEQVSEDRSYWQIRNLAIPFAKNGHDIDMLFMYTELTCKS